MSDSTDSQNTGIGQGIATLASFAVPALVAGLFGGAGVAGSLGAGMEGAGNLATQQMERQQAGQKALDEIIKQRQLQDYRNQKLLQQQEAININRGRAATYQQAVDSLGTFHTGEIEQQTRRNDIEALNAGTLSQVRAATINHLGVLSASTNLHNAEFQKQIADEGGERDYLVKHGYPGAATYSDATVKSVMAKLGGDYVSNKPDVTASNIKAAQDMGLPPSTIDAMKGWKGPAQAAFLQKMVESTTRSRTSAIAGVMAWGAGMKGGKSGSGASVPLGPDGKPDPKLAELFGPGTGPTAGMSPADKYQWGRQQIIGIDSLYHTDPAADLAAFDSAMGMKPTPTTEPAAATGPSGTAVSKPAGPTPTSTGAAKKPTAAAAPSAAPIGRASLPDGDYTMAGGKKVKVRAGHVYPG